MSRMTLVFSCALLASALSTQLFAAEVKTDGQTCYTGPIHLIQHAECAYRGRRPRCPAHGDHVIRSMTTGAAHELDGAVGFIF